jgi:hypothetical protein
MTHAIMKQPDEFKIPPGEFPDESHVIEAVVRFQKAMLAESQGGVAVRHAVPTNVVKAMADIATNIWKAKAKMLDGDSGEVRNEMKRVYRHIESVLESLNEVGLEVKDHTGDGFDYGLPLKVVTTQPTQGITRESVIETIKPTIYWEQQIIQMGEVVIATPASTETKT